MSGRGESGGGDREDERAFLAPGRGGDGGEGSGDDDRRDRMPGCFVFFRGWRKKRATASARSGRVASASLPPPPPPPERRDTERASLPPPPPPPERRGDITERASLPPPPPPPERRDTERDSSIDSKDIVGSDSKEIAVQVITELPGEIDCLIVSKIPSIFDRSLLQGVCGRWRSAALNCTTAPLPLIINADYTLSNYFAEGPQCVPQRMNPYVYHSDGLAPTALGTLDSWVILGYEAIFDPQVENTEQQKNLVRDEDTPVVATELPAEIDCLIVSKIPSIFDRSLLQGVCGRWRSAALNCTTAPLPVIINADYTLSNYFAEGPQCVPQRMNPFVHHLDGLASTALGTLDNWVIIGYEAMFDPQDNPYLVHTDCYLVQPLKGDTIRLPSPISFRCQGISGSLQILDGNGSLTFSRPTKEGRVRLQKASVYRTPGHMNFKVAALATQRGHRQLLFSTPNSHTWTIASASFITIGSDIEFLQEKLFVLGSNQTSVFVIEFGPHLCLFPTVSQVQRYTAVDTPVVENTEQQKNLVRDEEKLLLVVRYLTPGFDQLTAVRLCEMNATSNPISWKEKQSLGSKTILISLNSSVCFHTPPNTEIRSDTIYFLDHLCPHFLPVDNEQFSYRSQMYSLQSREISEQLIGREPASRRPGFPMWFCPSA